MGTVLLAGRSRALPKDRRTGKGEHMGHSFKGILAERNFQMVDESGQAVAYANSVWTFMDKQKGRPVKPGQDEIDAYGMEAPLEDAL